VRILWPGKWIPKATASSTSLLKSLNHFSIPQKKGGRREIIPVRGQGSLSFGQPRLSNEPVATGTYLLVSEHVAYSSLFSSAIGLQQVTKPLKRTCLSFISRHFRNRLLITAKTTTTGLEICSLQRFLDIGRLGKYALSVGFGRLGKYFERFFFEFKSAACERWYICDLFAAFVTYLLLLFENCAKLPYPFITCPAPNLLTHDPLCWLVDFDFDPFIFICLPRSQAIPLSLSVFPALRQSCTYFLTTCLVCRLSSCLKLL
jgi:hypothetical protein